MENNKILVVEDQMIIQMFIRKILSLAGFDVVGQSRSSNELNALITKTKPDLILMDIGIMGEVDGIEAARNVNKSFDIPIIFITGNTDESTLERARLVSPAGFVFKPIDEDQLVEKVKKVMEAVQFQD